MKQRACLFIQAAALQRASLVLFVLAAACQPVSPASLPSALPPTQAIVETATPSLVPTITLTASATPTVKQLIFPYTIDGLRQHDFQSGKIHIRSTLDDENQFYTSYLIDYPSDGLTITGVMQIPIGDGPFPLHPR